MTAYPAFDRRLCPHPLAFHLMLSSGTWMGGAAALPAFLGGLPFHDKLTAETVSLREQMSRQPPAALADAIFQESHRRIGEFTAGVQAYHAHPYRRPAIKRRSLAKFGSTRLLNIGGRKGQPGALLVPSLINPSYILDLQRDHSFAGYLKNQKLHTMLLDWGAPHNEECAFGLDDYITRRLEPALETAATHSGGPVHLIGYCMGGTIAVPLALHRPELVRSLTLIASPWDFHITSVTLIRALTILLSSFSEGVQTNTSTVPPDLLQIFFASLDPTLADRKFRRFSSMDQASDQARTFVAIEDWANDGVPLAQKVATECLRDWYGENAPAKGQWKVAEQTVHAEDITCPTLVVAPKGDRIVPPESALALARAIPQADVLRASAGHVSMMAGPDAEQSLWAPITTWISAQKNP